MTKKIAGIMALVLVMTIFAVFNFSGPAKAQLPDHSVGGKVYICDNGSPLNGTAWEDTTGFAIWTNNTTVAPPGFKWTRYPQSGWILTEKGRYSTTIPYADKNINWTNGGEYRVEFDATPLGYRRTNATSNGTGSFVTAPPLPENGNPEFSDFGNVSNNLSYWEWGMPVQTDDFQLWDVIIN
jgi:hypothetical protein